MRVAAHFSHSVTACREQTLRSSGRFAGRSEYRPLRLRSGRSEAPYVAVGDSDGSTDCCSEPRLLHLKVLGPVGGIAVNLGAILRRRHVAEDVPKDDHAARHFAKSVCEWNSPKVRVLPPESREALAELLAAAVREAYPTAPPSELARQVAAEMAAIGYSKLVPAMPAQQAGEVVRYFEFMPCLNKHVEILQGGDGVRRDPRGDARRFSFGTYTQEEIFAAPHLLETITAPVVLDAVEAFLGARPMLFSLNAYWSFPQPGEPSYGQDFHRDMSHPKFCALFIYLTDTDVGRGAHQYIRGTPSPAALAAMLRSRAIDCDERQFFGLERDGLGFTDLYERHLSFLMETISGPAGTMFLEDPYGTAPWHRADRRAAADGVGPLQRISRAADPSEANRPGDSCEPVSRR